MPQCRDCHRSIRWETLCESGKKMPLDVGHSPEHGNVILGEDGLARIFPSAAACTEGLPRYTIHFDTCPSPQPRGRKR